jgi:hypothetical protein
MKHVVEGALVLVMARITQCVKTQKASPDYESQSYWHEQKMKAVYLKSRIEKRFNVTHNVLYVDFTAKKRVA